MSRVLKRHIDMLALSLVIVECMVVSVPSQSQWISGAMVSLVTFKSRYMSPWASQVSSEQCTRYSASVVDLEQESHLPKKFTYDAASR